MDGLINLLPLMIRLCGDNEEVREQAVFAAWRVAAGPALSNTCRPVRLHRKNLTLAVIDETWKKQMGSMSRELIHRVNSILDQQVVTFLEFRVDASQILPARRASVDPFADVREAPADLQEAASGIKDENLRSLFLRVAMKSIQRGEGQ